VGGDIWKSFAIGSDDYYSGRHERHGEKMKMTLNIQPKMIPIFLYLLLMVGIGGFWGCASQNNQSDIFKQGEYKKIIETQKRIGEVQAKEETLKKLPEMTVEELESWGDDYLRQNNIDAAFTYYDKALHLDPSRILIRYKIGMLYLKKGLADGAIREFREILKKDDHYALAFEGMGHCFLKMGKLDEAEKNFRQALKLAPDLWQSHNFLGIIYDRQKRFDLAIVEYQAAIALKPDEGLLYNNLGFSCYLKGEYENAVDAYMRALKNNYSHPKLYNNLALALGKMGRYQEAADLFKKMGENAKALNNMGLIYLGQGKREQAIASFEKAIELKPSYYTKAAENLEKAKMAPSQKEEPRIESQKAEAERRKIEAESRKPEAIASESNSPEHDKTDEVRHYAIQISSWERKSTAMREVEKLKTLGYEASVKMRNVPGEKTRYRVLIGRFQSWQEAQELREQLKNEKGIDHTLLILKDSSKVKKAQESSFR
jgi:pentatricopeptide repeat protein